MQSPTKSSSPQREGESKKPSEITRAKQLSRILDSAVKIPGSRGMGIGVDAVIGLIPGVGDVLSTALSTYVVYVAARAGVPLTALGRMVGNIAIDQLVGTIPILGDIFDVAFKANVKNVRILEAAVSDDKEIVPRTSGQISALVSAVAITLLVIVICSLFGTVLLIGYLLS